MNATIFFGNGINRISDKPLDWNELLKRLAVYASVKVDLAEKPYTMIYEELLLRSKSMDESNIKKYIQQELQVTDISSLYERLYSIGVTNYITTNYDFSLESIFEEKLYRKDFRKQETLYSIRTHITMSNQDNDINIWHVHGDIERIPSIALGLDHYYGSVSKIDAYLKGNYSYIEDKKEKRLNGIIAKLNGTESFDSVSWIELFYNTNVHIIGFGLDYSEIDIWWILNKRQRYIKSSKTNLFNKIYYYDIKPQDAKRKSKHDLLVGFGVDLITVDLVDNNWENATVNLLEKMEQNIQARR